MMRRPLLLAALGPVLAAATLLACSGSEAVLVDPVFEVEITGAVTRTTAGVATFGVVAAGASTGFTILLDDDADVTIAFQKPASARPVPGDYPIVPRDDVAPLGEYRGEVRVVADGFLQVYEAQSGALVVAEASSAFLRGSFAFQAERTSPCCDLVPVTIEVEGTYTALPGPVAPASR